MIRTGTIMALLCLSLACMAESRRIKAESLAADYKRMCKAVVAADLKKAPLEFAYLLPWGVSYDMDALIEGYLFSGDREYLDLFVDLGDKAVECRADKMGAKDWKGRLPKGWLASPHYGTSGPETLLDLDGNPSLSIRGTALCMNDKTEVFTTLNEDGTFSIESRNADKRISHLNRKLEGLTMDNVEAKVNTAKGYTQIKVKRLGEKPPATAGPVTMKSNSFVMHGHHTGKCVIPLLRFAELVKADKALDERYGAAAARYLQCASEAMDDMAGDWRDHEHGGYIVFEPGLPFWSDGVAEPNNTLSLSAIAYLLLYKLTSAPHYKERAEKLAQYLKEELVPLEDGSAMFYYWSKVNRHGWTEEAGCTNLPVLSTPKPYVEDMSHMQHSLRFYAEFCRSNVVITREDLGRLARSFHLRIDKGLAEGPEPNEIGKRKAFADRFDGSLLEGSAYQTFQAGWAEFRDFEPVLVNRVWDLYVKGIPKSISSSRLYTLGTLLRFQLGKGGDATIVE